MAARRPSLLFVLLLLPIVPLWKTVFRGEVIGPWGHLAQAAPWSAPADPRAFDVLQMDGVLQTYLWRDLVLRSWGRGELPLWNSAELGGIPLLANSQSGALYPPHVLLGVLQVPTATALNLLAWAHLAFAGLGAAWLARRLGANEMGALVAGAVFSMSPWMLAWSPLGTVIATAAWIPWILAAALPSEREWWRIHPALAPCVACMLLAGHLQIAAYGLIGAAAVAIVYAVAKRGSVLTVVAAAVGCLVGVAGAWPQVGPSLALSREGHRQSVVSEAGQAAFMGSAVQPWRLATAAFPNVLGLPGQPALPGTELAHLPGYWPAYTQRGDAFAESALGIGPFALGLLAWLRRKRSGVPIVLGSVGVLLALGPLSLFLYRFVPGWAASGSPGRALVLVLVAAAVAAGAAWPDPDDRPCPRRPVILLLAGASFAVTTAFAIGSRASAWLPAFQPVVAEAAVNAVLAALPGVVLGSALALVAFRVAESGKGALALGLGLAAQFCVGVAAIVPSGKVPATPDGSPLSGRVAFVNEDWSLFGMAQVTAPPNSAVLLGVEDAGGYDSLLPKSSVDRLAAAVGGDPAPQANGNMMLVKPSADPALVAGLGADQMVSRNAMEVLGSPKAVWRGLYVYDVSPGRASTPAGRAEIVEDTATGVVVTAEGPGTLTLRDAFASGWTAAVDGEPAELGPGPWRTVELPAGTHTVSFHYRPAHLSLLPLLGLPLILSLALVLGRRQNNPVQ